MSENREEILANFQSITAIDDVAEAIFHLEEENWDLLAAIHRVLPQDNINDQISIADQQDQQHHRSHQSSLFSSPLLENLNNFDEHDSDINIISTTDTPSSRSVCQTNRNIYGADPSTSNSIDLTNEYVSHNDTRKNKPSDITFNVHYKSNIHQIALDKNSTIGDLKILITSFTNVPTCHQLLRGWPGDKNIAGNENSTVLNSLVKQRLYNLDLTNMAECGLIDYNMDNVEDNKFCSIASIAAAAAAASSSKHFNTATATPTNTTSLPTTSTTSSSSSSSLLNNQTFTLNIFREPEGTSITLHFPGKQTVLEVKADIFTITDIPVRYQVWTGWPANVTKTTTLAESGIDYEHNFILRSMQPISTTSTTSTSTTVTSQTTTSSSLLSTIITTASTSTLNASTNLSSNIDIDTDSSSVEEFEDASDFNGDDEIFTDNTTTTPPMRLKYLIPNDTDDESVGCIQFIHNYEQRYGKPYPPFFRGSLEDALRSACHRPVRDRKLLAIYLHHDCSVLTNVFCDHLLKCESIMESIHQNFVLYGWDLTFESNKNLFLSSLAACVGGSASITVRNISVFQLPSIVIVGKNRSICEVLSVIHGNVGIDDLLAKLMDTIIMYSDQREIEMREEDERTARELVKMEQDAAYNESLEADRRKEEAKRQKEYALATERIRLESERQEIEAIREANRLVAESYVPTEPDLSVNDCTKIRIRTPSGEHIERRFTGDTKLSILLKYIESKGYPTQEFKVIASWPRQDLTTANHEETLRNLKLYPQETVILEER